MAQIILDMPCYVFKTYGKANVMLTHKASGESVFLTSKETECFLHDYANWHDAMGQSYLAAMLWEAHAAPILQKESA